MASKTHLVEAIVHHRWKDVANDLAESPQLIEHRDERGRNLLHLCCGVAINDKGIGAAAGKRIADLLFELGIDIDAPAFTEGAWHATPLWYATSRGRNLPLARHLLNRGCNPNHCLWAAGFNNDVAAIRLLAAYGADIDPVTEDETPFLSAVKVSHFEPAEALLTLGANVNFQDSHGMTALHYMLKKNSDVTAFEMLMKYRPRGDLVDAHGRAAVDVMARKRDAAFKQMAARLAAFS